MEMNTTIEKMFFVAAAAAAAAQIKSHEPTEWVEKHEW